MLVQPYLAFNGRCEEAIEFYREALGAEVKMLVRFKESPEPSKPGTENKIMHARLQIGETIMLLSDGRCLEDRKFQNFSLSLTVADEAEADRLFAALAPGGQVQMPMTKTFFSPRFGILVDRFGVSWMIYLPQ
jgi:PhnB protein